MDINQLLEENWKLEIEIEKLRNVILEAWVKCTQISEANEIEELLQKFVPGSDWKSEERFNRAIEFSQKFKYSIRDIVGEQEPQAIVFAKRKLQELIQTYSYENRDGLAQILVNGELRYVDLYTATLEYENGVFIINFEEIRD